MKRIYFLLATMAACLMAGCTNDEVIDLPEEEDGLFLSIGISDGVTTKADPDPLLLTGEDKINNLTVLLFNGEEGTYVTGKRVVSEGEASLNFVGDLEVNPGTYDILLIANTATDYTNTKPSLTELNGDVADVTTQTTDNLLMVSQLYNNVELNYLPDEVTGGYKRKTYSYMFNGGGLFSKEERQNDYSTSVYTGSEGATPVVLTRLASRIQLESLAVDFTENLEGATFQLDQVYLVNARPTTLLIPDGTSYEAGEGYYRGAPVEFDVLDGMIAPSATVKENYAKAYTGVIIDGETTKTFAGGTDMFQVYAFENHTAWQYTPTEEKTAYDTRLVISGKITLSSGQVQPQSYYHVEIKGAEFQLERNKVYGVNVKITSYGYNNPDGRTGGGDDDPGSDNAKIDVNITVNPWNVIDQYEEDEV